MGKTSLIFLLTSVKTKMLLTLCCPLTENGSGKSCQFEISRLNATSGVQLAVTPVISPHGGSFFTCNWVAVRIK